MRSEMFERVVVLMARIAERDRAALFSLADEFGGPIVAAVRSHLRHMGVDHIARDELDGLAIDACEAIWDVAPAWDPEGGALPWVWASHRVRAVAARHVGQHADPLDERAAAEAPAPVPLPGTEADETTLLRRLAAHDADCALLLEALDRVTTPRNQAVVLAVRVQERLGDPAPAATVARQFGMRSDAVRQVKRRTLLRLRDLAAREARYEPLADLPFLVA
jgi:hypothetical protein